MLALALVVVATAWGAGVQGETGFQLVRAGSFTMGSPQDEVGRDADEVEFMVTLSRSFLVGRTEVTQAEFLEMLGRNPSKLTGCWGIDEPGYVECPDNTRGIVASREGAAPMTATCIESDDVGDFDADGRADLLLGHTDCAMGSMAGTVLDLYIDRPGGPRRYPLNSLVSGETVGYSWQTSGGKLVLEVETVTEIRLDDDGPEPTRKWIGWNAGKLSVSNPR